MTQLKFGRCSCAVAGAMALVIGLGAGVAGAATYSDIKPPAPGEFGHEGVFEQVYGGGAGDGSFSLAGNGRDYIGSGVADGVTAIRLADDNPSGEDDQIWSGAMLGNLPTSAVATARFARDPQIFGYVHGVTEDPETEFQALFEVSGSGFNVDGSNLGFDLRHLEAFRWARKGPAGALHTSYEADNFDPKTEQFNDHLVTYRIEGLPGLQPVYMLFFEDSYKDWDYQDLVVEIAAVAVPTPAAIGPGLALLGMLGLTRRRRTRD